VDLSLALGEDAAALDEVVHELLDRLHVLTCTRRAASVEPAEILERPESPPPAIARVWIARTSEGVRLYLVDSGWDRVLVRHVEQTGPLDEVAREELAHIVQSAVEALLSGATIGVARPELARPRPRPVELLARYTLRVQGGGLGATHELGASAALTFSAGGVHPYGSLSIGYRLPSVVESTLVRIDVTAIAVRLEGGLAFPLLAATTLRATVGLGVDLLFVEPAAVAGVSIDPTESSRELAPLATIGVSVRQEFLAGIVGALGVGADIELLDTRFVVEEEEGAQPSVIADPNFLRPTAFIAIGGAL